MKKFIQNRNKQNISVVVEGEGNLKGLAFVMHGLGGNKDEPHIRAAVDAFLQTGYRVVSFDTTNSFGESDGQYQDATLTGYYHDLQDVIAWTSQQPWYTEPFVLAGHSFGGMSTSLYAQTWPKRVRALAPISAVISGGLTLLTPKSSPRWQYLEQWRQSGLRTVFEGGHERHLKWTCMQDRLKYCLLAKAHKLTMPVLLITGDADEATPAEHQQLLLTLITGRKELRTIPGAHHELDKPHECQTLKTYLTEWLPTV